MREDYEYFDVKRNDGVATIHFRVDLPTSPKTRDTTEVIALLRDLDESDDVSVGVFVGGPDRFGTTRPPQGQLAGGGSGIRSYTTSRSFIKTLMELEKPLVVALRGDVRPPLGLTLAVMSDIVVAEQNAIFSDTHVLLDIPPSGSAFAWPLLIGLLNAKRFLLTGDSFSAEDAFRMGLVTDVVAPGQAENKALELAARISEHRVGVQLTKRALHRWLAPMFPTYEAAQGEARMVTSGPHWDPGNS